RVGHGNLSRRVGERLKTALLMMRRCLHNRGGSRRVDRNVVRQALAETYCNLGLALRPFDLAGSGRWFLRAAAAWPGYRPAWRALVGLCIPAPLQSLLRAKNWDDVYRCPENDPKNI